MRWSDLTLDLTDDDIQQSIDRSGGQYGNKGTEAAIAGIKMSNF